MRLEIHFFISILLAQACAAPATPGTLTFLADCCTNCNGKQVCVTCIPGTPDCTGWCRANPPACPKCL